MFAGSDSELFDDDLDVLMREFFVEYGDNPDASTILSPFSDSSIDTPATSGFSPETPESLYEHAADSHDQIAIPPPTPLSLLTRIGKGGPEGRIAANSDTTNEVIPSSPRGSRRRRGGPCPLICGRDLSRLDHYRLNNHYISCPNYTGDREALRFRYGNRRKPKKAKEKDMSQAQAQAQSEATTAVVLVQPLPPRVCLDEQAPCNNPINSPDRRRNFSDSTSSDANSPLARNRSGFPPYVQEPSIEVQTAMTTETDQAHTMMDLLGSQSGAYASRYSIPHNGSASATYPANDVCLTQPYSPDIQGAMHIIPGQPQSHWGSVYPAQVSISTNAVADRHPACLEPNCPAYGEFANEIQKTTTDHYPAMELPSLSTLDFHKPMLRNGVGNAMYNDESMLQHHSYAIDSMPTLGSFHAAHVPSTRNVVVNRHFVEPINLTYAQESNLYPAMRLSSQPALDFHSSIPGNGNGDAPYPTNGTIMFQLGSYTNTQNSDWHSHSATSGWEQS